MSYINIPDRSKISNMLRVHRGYAFISRLAYSCYIHYLHLNTLYFAFRRENIIIGNQEVLNSCENGMLLFCWNEISTILSLYPLTKAYLVQSFMSRQL